MPKPAKKNQLIKITEQKALPSELEIKPKKKSGIPPLGRQLRSIKGFVLVDDLGITLYFPEHARLHSANQILAMLQSKRRGMLFDYKKACHELIKRTVAGIKIPDLKPPLSIFLYRSAPRMVDQDALSFMFKYLIDGLKNTDDGIGVIKNDDPTQIRPSRPFQEKGEYMFGLRIEEAPEEPVWPWLVQAKAHAAANEIGFCTLLPEEIMKPKKLKPVVGLSKTVSVKSKNSGTMTIDKVAKVNPESLGLQKKPAPWEKSREIMKQALTKSKGKTRWTEEDVLALQNRSKK